MKLINQKYRISALVILLLVLSGCAVTAPIQPAASSKSQFEGAVYSGDTVILSSNNIGSEEFRVFNQGASSFVPIQDLRDDAERRATEFCNRSSHMMKPLRETTSKPPHILGNFPRVEIIFACIEKSNIQVLTPKSDNFPVAPQPTDTIKQVVSTPVPNGAISQNKTIADKLTDLKMLLKNGLINQKDYDAKKQEILKLL